MSIARTFRAPCSRDTMVKDGVIEFYWTDPQGARQWFTFAKVK